MAKEATLEALLAPWWEVFSDGKLMIQHDRWKGGLRRQFYAFCFEISTPTRDAVRDQYNAFELLCLASVLNPTAFMRMVRDKCSFVAPFMHWDGFVEDQVVPCRLWVALEDTPGKRKLSKWRRDALMLVLSAGMSRLDSESFLETRTALLAMAETPEKCKQCEDMTIDVEVRLVYLSEDPLAAILERLVTSHELRAQNDQRANCVRTRFVSRQSISSTTTSA
ncbi:hypothetical protein Poli38472_006747 [Pythium oligandrum]|uniref:Uncharacterized protein n=1 Tax=Pythium oligandrum TaxID=41045 RepID=A0A8K1C574_PYTOL|nr:hypothetical protein Poli38472_006747 [Pythium oligandrum]|eukprot:TMW56737.1 hypothetical protein Poli38472_006747 [Pythium oligandrum]